MIQRTLLALALVLPLAAQGSRCQREILPSGPGPNRLDVDLPLLGGARPDLGDLRLKDAAGREVPYVLVPPTHGEVPWTGGRLLPLPATKDTSGFELDLGHPVQTSRMRVEGLRVPFLKRCRLEGSGDRQHWTELIREGSLFDLPEEGLRLLQADFPAGEYRYLHLVWDDHSSARMGLPRTATVQPESPANRRPMLASLPFERRSAEPGVSWFAVRLPGPRLPLRALVLDVGGTGPLLREARLAEGRLQAGGLIPFTLGRAELRRARREDAVAADLRIATEVPEGTDLDLRVEDGDNPPLELTGVKAELEPQPWIYFEAPTGEPLTAQFGDPTLPAPHYDLEALRTSLDPSRTAPARWGAMRAGASGAAMAPSDLDLGPGAPLDSGGFRFHRPVPEAPSGLAVLELDAHVLSQSRTLQDVRILDREGRQIPYLLEQRDEPLSLELTLPKGRSAGRSTLYALALPQRSLPASRLVLETSARVFQRRILVREEGPGGPPRVLQEEIWKHGDPDHLPPPLVLTLPDLEEGTLTVEVEEGDNPSLPLTHARLLLPTWRLRFFHPGEELTLCYGREMETPRYDLALLADRLRNVPARELSLPPQDGTKARDHAAILTRVFWGVLGLAVVALLGMLARLLKHPAAPE